MRKIYLLIFITATAIAAKAQSGYLVSDIPKELLSHASAVIRTNEITTDVNALDEVITTNKLAITVLNKNGDGDAAISIWYNKTERLKSFKGIIYDEFGKPMGKLAERDLSDNSAADGYSLFMDDRVKRFRPAVNTYPYTVEYEYQTLSKQTLMFDSWNPNINSSTSLAIQHSAYTIVCKPNFNIRFKEINYPGKALINTTPASTRYSWEVNNIKARRDEPFSPVNQLLFTSVKIAPEKFSYGNINGSFTNWKEYGGFVYNKLVRDRQQLPPETIALVKEMTGDITDPKLKAKKIYEYVQQKTRYVSVQIGIGGWQPFLATDVDKLSYGDCKALVNYTQSLLNAAGIESYYVLNMAGSEKVSAIPDFASMNQFDHVILCMPFKNDTTWVDCTSKENPFGYLGDFTDDRLVVACTPAGGLLLHTPRYAPTDNSTTRKATFALSADGYLNGDMTTLFKGTEYDSRDYMINETFDEQVKKIKRVYPIENLEVKSLVLKQDKGLNPVTTETIKMEARDYVAQNGGRFFFIPNTASRYIKPIKDITNRSNPVYINRGYNDNDEVTYTLPEGYRIATKLLELTIDKPFGKYQASMQLIGNKLVYKRHMQLNDGNFSKETYSDMVDFFETVYEADNYTLTMEKGK